MSVFNFASPFFERQYGRSDTLGIARTFLHKRSYYTTVGDGEGRGGTDCSRRIEPEQSQLESPVHVPLERAHHCAGAGLTPPGAMSGAGGCALCSQVTSGRLRNINPIVWDLQLVPIGLSTGCEL